MIILLEDSDTLDEVAALPPLKETDWMLKINDPDIPFISHRYDARLAKKQIEAYKLIGQLSRVLAELGELVSK